MEAGPVPVLRSQQALKVRGQTLSQGGKAFAHHMQSHPAAKIEQPVHARDRGRHAGRR